MQVRNYLKNEYELLKFISSASNSNKVDINVQKYEDLLLYKDRIDNETDIYIQRLLDEGAIPLLKTTTPEFCILGTTHSTLYGVTRNPWNLDYSPGGSSGG